MRTLILKAEVLERVPFSYPTIWQKMRRGEFPLSVQLDDAGNKVAWFEDEIDEWIESRKRVELKPLSEAEAKAATTKRPPQRSRQSPAPIIASVGEPDQLTAPASP